jgi:hypothetical protein
MVERLPRETKKMIRIHLALAATLALAGTAAAEETIQTRIGSMPIPGEQP